jgi:asparagine synthase (glutamine-hydrolysing)
MCGIVGVFGKPDSGTVQRMLDTLTHRGPDDGFLISGDEFTLGARRLSIVDIEGGRQPLSNEKGNVWACQNGELYNYPEVRPTLQEKGHILRTHSDTEMLPHLYEEHGLDMVPHVDGMFAFAVWDDVGKVGLLARDRTGQKPLYYLRMGEALYFASEIKSLLEVPGFERRINYDALHHYLSLKHTPHPLTIFRDIYMLPPAHQLIFRPGQDVRISRYWELSFATPHELDTISEEEAVDELLRLLRRGVKRRFMSDVPLGFFLSGGIDSSLSTVLAAELSSQPIKSFTLTYGDTSTTKGKEADRYWASWVAERYGTEHHEETIVFDDFPDSIGRIIRHFDEPFAGVVSTYFLAEAIAKHVKVALAGDGADELFGSYLSHRSAFPLASLSQYRETGDLDLIRPFTAVQVDFLSDLYEEDDWRWRAKLLVFSEAEKRALYTDKAARQSQADTGLLLKKEFGDLTATDPLNRILEMEFRTFFPDQVLAFVDRLSMAHSLEVRTAYLDTAFVEFIAALPGRYKIKGGETKYLLKKAAERYFPQEMVFRPKEGFLMPVTQWILNDLEDYVRDTLCPGNLNRHGLFDPAAVERQIDEMYADGSDYRLVNKVLAVLIFQVWYDIYCG